MKFPIPKPLAFFLRLTLWIELAAPVLLAMMPGPQGRPIMPPRQMPGTPPPAEPAFMRMRVEDGWVTAEIRAEPIQQVLEELAARSGIVFEVPTQENDPVSVTFYKVTLQEAVERLAGSSNFVIYYAPDGAGGNRIQLVRIFSRPGRNPQPSLRYIGTGAVTKTGEDALDSPDQAIKALAESQKVDVREKAVEVLVAAKGEAAIQALTLAVDDPAPEVRVAAIEGLATLGVRASLPAIVKCLKDAHPGVRQSAIVAIALMGDAENLKELRPLRKDPDPSVATAAETAIKKLSTRRPGP